MSRTEFILENKHLFWYISNEKLPEISDEVLVEFIMNYGDWDTTKKMFQIVGYSNLRKVYEGLSERQKANYFPEMLNMLKNVVNQYA